MSGKTCLTQSNINPYIALNIPDYKKSDIKYIKKIFNDLIKCFHSDKGGDSNMHIILVEAYKILSNPFLKFVLDEYNYEVMLLIDLNEEDFITLNRIYLYLESLDKSNIKNKAFKLDIIIKIKEYIECKLHNDIVDLLDNHKSESTYNIHYKITKSTLSCYSNSLYLDYILSKHLFNDGLYNNFVIINKIKNIKFFMSHYLNLYENKKSNFKLEAKIASKTYYSGKNTTEIELFIKKNLLYKTFNFFNFFKYFKFIKLNQSHYQVYGSIKYNNDINSIFEQNTYNKINDNCIKLNKFKSFKVIKPCINIMLPLTYKLAIGFKLNIKFISMTLIKAFCLINKYIISNLTTKSNNKIIINNNKDKNFKYYIPFNSLKTNYSYNKNVSLQYKYNFFNYSQVYSLNYSINKSNNADIYIRNDHKYNLYHINLAYANEHVRTSINYNSNNELTYNNTIPVWSCKNNNYKFKFSLMSSFNYNFKNDYNSIIYFIFNINGLNLEFPVLLSIKNSTFSKILFGSFTIITGYLLNIFKLKTRNNGLLLNKEKLKINEIKFEMYKNFILNNNYLSGLCKISIDKFNDNLFLHNDLDNIKFNINKKEFDIKYAFISSKSKIKSLYFKLKTLMEIEYNVINCYIVNKKEDMYYLNNLVNNSKIYCDETINNDVVIDITTALRKYIGINNKFKQDLIPENIFDIEGVYNFLNIKDEDIYVLVRYGENDMSYLGNKIN